MITAPPETWQHGFLVANGVRFHYVTQGSGPLVLLLHGFPEFWYSWRRQIPALAGRFRVVAPDLRGYNDSEKPPSGYDLPTLAEDVRGLVEALGERQAVVVGHDWGGAIAWAFAMRHPELLRRLVVLNAPHPAAFQRGLRLPEQLARSWYVGFFQLPWLPEALIRFRDYEVIERVMAGWARRPAAFTREDLEAYKDALNKRGALRAALQYYRETARREALRLLQRRPVEYPIIYAPTLLIWAEDDRALSKELTYGLERWVRDLTVKYVPNCSHWVQQEQPELVNRYLLEFLDDVH